MTCEAIRATAPPTRPIRGKPQWPKIRSQSPPRWTALTPIITRSGVTVSPRPRKTLLRISIRNRAGMPKIVTERYWTHKAAACGLTPIHPTTRCRSGQTRTMQAKAARNAIQTDWLAAIVALSGSLAPVKRAMRADVPIEMDMPTENSRNMNWPPTPTAARAFEPRWPTKKRSVKELSVWSSMVSTDGHASIHTARCRPCLVSSGSVRAGSGPISSS